MAQGLAQYLAGVETQQVQAQAASLSRTVASAVAQAQQRWLAAQAHYYLVCGCIAGQSHAKADPATVARLHAELAVLQADYAAAASRYTALLSNPVPVAAVLPGSVSAVRASAASPLKAVLLAAVVGLVLSSGLVALLDVRRRVLPAPAAARRQRLTAASRRAPRNQGLARKSEHDGRQAGAKQDPRARLSALIPQLSEHDVELLLRMAERLLARPDVSPAMSAARPRVAPCEQVTPATPAPPHLMELLSDPAVRAILENLAPYSEDVRVALRVARALDRA
jgi:hypothetical protein